MNTRWPRTVVAVLCCCSPSPRPPATGVPHRFSGRGTPTDTLGNSVYEPVAAYANQRAGFTVKGTCASDGRTFLSFLAKCLPATVDPRGSKGK
jgi:hypothetical protein